MAIGFDKDGNLFIRGNERLNNGEKCEGCGESTSIIDKEPNHTQIFFHQYPDPLQPKMTNVKRRNENRNVLHIPYDPSDPKDVAISNLCKQLCDLGVKYNAAQNIISELKKQIPSMRKVRARVIKKEEYESTNIYDNFTPGDVYSYKGSDEEVVLIAILPRKIIDENVFQSDNTVVFYKKMNNGKISIKQGPTSSGLEWFTHYYTRVDGKNIFKNKGE